MSYFDHFATSPSTWVGRWFTLTAVRQEYRFLRTHLHNKQAVILEIGPGHGEFADLLRKGGFTNYTGVEPNHLMRESLAHKGVKVKNYLIPKLQEDDDSYDVIFLFDVFEHLNDTAEAKLFVSEAYRVLRPGGLLCIGCPDYNHWGVDFFNCDYSHSNITTVRRTRQLFMNFGMRTLEFAYLSGFAKGWLATLLSYLVRMGLFFVRSADNEQKLYKLKLTFLRRFIIVGMK
ncbi:class I SAM-dependent methyltransferase [Oscillochloris sp. ZM17-4]|uniref:class I SAM-dependent methyltransferase n=1 Tax=Oscillochloris sp. ZM17-4 TaxID=2866714 RepID=UPI001C738E5E|nr:class I SAM-dependent methyltransferase [Oscillochloris sp. ZM17-4]MBX0331033.1 class I SAM-dependent methyltransferase [Oscillochloris sp. ZM17-4]